MVSVIGLALNLDVSSLIKYLLTADMGEGMKWSSYLVVIYIHNVAVCLLDELSGLRHSIVSSTVVVDFLS